MKMADSPKGYKRLEGSERHPPKNAEHLGAADGQERFEVTIALRRRTDGSPPPDFDYFRKTLPHRRQRLSPQAFATKYGAHPDDIRRVEDFARSHGLTVLDAHPARRTVRVSGTVEQMSKAFGVTLGRYRHTVGGRRGARQRVETYRGRDGFIHVPQDLDKVIVGVFGLDNRTITKRNGADPPGTAPLPTTTVTKLYNFPTNFAAGQTIGIVSEGGYLASDIASTFGGNPPQVTDVSVDGATNGGFPDGETTQDICIAGLAAPGAAIAVYFQPGDEMGWVNLFLTVAHPSLGDPLCSVVSSSFYICDGDDTDTLTNEGISSGLLSAVSAAFMDAAIQGVTICIASGDTGANSKVGGDPAAWGLGFPPDHKAHVQFPGSSPWVLAVGGTTIGNISGTSFDEYVWNDPNALDPSQWGTTGGGVSAFFPLPSYQSDAGVPLSLYNGTAGRGVPDVAGNASLHSGYSGIIVGGSPFVGNGTSASSPLWAGLIAVVNGALGVNVGFVNPVIYALGSSVFRSILPGAGPANNSNSGITGYPAGPGWDACTGWGSPKGAALLLGLRRFYGPVISVALEDNLRFGTVCGGPKFLTLHVYNTGTTDLMVLSVKRVAGSGDFTVLPAPTTPLAIVPGSQIDFMIQYQPTTRGVPEAATFQIVSDDPVTPHLDVSASGAGGTGKLVVSGSTHFGAVKACRCAERTLSLCNAGDCKLNVASVTFRRHNPHWKLVNNPFPAALHPGSCLSVVVRYKASERVPRSCDLVIVSDDPETPTRMIEVTAYTEWSCGCCDKCCEQQRKGRCEQRSVECCTRRCAEECDQAELAEDHCDD
jgi:kumamolisin